MTENLHSLRGIKYYLTFILLLPCVLATRAQNIQGVINQYAKVTYLTNTRAVVNNLVFAVHDTVMIIQMKGATINTPNTAAYGQITALNSAGYYEFNTVKSISGDTVTFNIPLCHTYSVPDSVQLIRVPSYNGNATVIDTLKCAPWANGVGGVLVFYVQDTLILNSAISADYNGFRGGTIFGNFFNCSSTTDFYTSAASFDDGAKGEGIAQYISGQECGRAPLANGGGGAGAGNTGAGGGANFGIGGNGGYQYSACAAAAINALYFSYGGYSPTFTPDRVFMGGGGGGPQNDNGFTVYDGGNGGGIIFIKAGAIKGNGNIIHSNGASIVPVIQDEGTSAGGAGGAVYLLCNNYSGALNIDLNGGFGGSNFNILFAGECHGPGGGGGGGLAWFSTPSTPAGVSVVATGGAAGMVNNPISPCYNTTNGAEPGQAGASLYNLKDAFLNYTLPSVDTYLCSSDFQLQLSLDSGFHNFLWSTGATTSSITVTHTGVYSVQALTPVGCTIFDTLIVNRDSIVLNDDTALCFGKSITLKPLPSNIITSYEWQDNSTGSSYAVTGPGTYMVTVHTVHNCILSDTTHVMYYFDTGMRILGSRYMCPGDSVTLSTAQQFSKYTWSTGQTSSLIFGKPGFYSLTVTTKNGCVETDTATLQYYIKPQPYLGDDTSLCFNLYDTVQLNPGNFFAYTWQDNSHNPTFTVNAPGLYTVTVTTEDGCSNSNQVTISNNPNCPNHFFIPNAFTPNNDGLNDFFRIRAQDVYALGDFHLMIFDRFGNRVYNSYYINQGWDGTFLGVPCDVGTYFWTLQFEAKDNVSLEVKTNTINGDLTLIR